MRSYFALDHDHVAEIHKDVAAGPHDFFRHGVDLAVHHIRYGEPVGLIGVEPNALLLQLLKHAHVQ